MSVRPLPLWKGSTRMLRPGSIGVPHQGQAASWIGVPTLAMLLVRRRPPSTLA
jgi:hypothetical protein